MSAGQAKHRINHGQFEWRQVCFICYTVIYHFGISVKCFMEKFLMFELPIPVFLQCAYVLLVYPLLNILH